LFVPVVQVEKFEQTLSMWHVHFMNNTDRRYVVNFDVTYEKDRDRSTQYNEQHKATVRGDAYVTFPLTNLPDKVTRVVGIDVFGCSFTAPSESSDSRPTVAPQTRPEAPAPQGAPSRGASMTIADAQKLLATKGYDVGAADGSLGPRTVRALRAFQTDRKIRISGQLDRATISELLK
jgi:hypothetical protein